MNPSWVLWYQDLFDRESPRQIELRGRGLEAGLAALWQRHLFETILADGKMGFACFNLWLEADRISIQIQGDLIGQQRLRAWVFDRPAGADVSESSAAGSRLLATIARAHARLLQAGQGSQVILEAARESANRQAFAAHLVDWSK